MFDGESELKLGMVKEENERKTKSMEKSDKIPSANATIIILLLFLLIMLSLTQFCGRDLRTR